MLTAAITYVIIRPSQPTKGITMDQTKHCSAATAAPIQRDENTTNYLCEAAPGTSHVRHRRQFGQHQTDVGLTRWHDENQSLTGLALIANAGAFHFHLGITAAEARELAQALTQAAFELDIAQSESAKVAA